MPVIDLSRSEAEVAVVLRQACVEHGFFYGKESTDIFLNCQLI